MADDERVALLDAAACGSWECITHLVKDGLVDVNYINEAGDQEHALLEAAKAGHLQAVKLLIAYGAKINRADANGHTALWAASR